METKYNCWLWPDHVIGKKESRRLREAHNAAIGSQIELRNALQACHDLLNHSDVKHFIGHKLGEMSRLHSILRNNSAALVRATN